MVVCRMNHRINLASRLAHYNACVESPEILVMGRLIRTVGLTLEATGFQPSLGSRCLILGHKGLQVEAEVVGFSGDVIHLMPLDTVAEIYPGARVVPILKSRLVPVGEQMLGRVLDGKGQPIDGAGPLPEATYASLSGERINPLARDPIRAPLDVGVRCINGLFCIGRGQRMGLFAGSGVGKSVLMGMMTRYTKADVTVVALIGERGREVKEFIEDILGQEGMRRSVVVASPADDPPLLRLQGAMLACAIAEYFRNQGKNVLFLMDSLTRFAQAQREIAIATGEPPATKGYPPSVFYKLTQLVERAGNGHQGQGQGSITAFYTVLTEGDDVQDPVADSARAILDGHVVLSRKIAEEGIYPAIDIEASISRAMPQCVDAAWLEQAMLFKRIYATYQQNKDLISIGAYTQGTDAGIDKAIALFPKMKEFIRQKMTEPVPLEKSKADLNGLLAGSGQAFPVSGQSPARVTRK